MLDYNVLSLFFMTSIILALAPGPDNLFVLAQAAQHGKKAGLLVTMGLCTGILFHTTAVSLGLAAVFAASAMAFTLLKVAGIVYLLYLAWLSFRADAETGGAAKVEQLSGGKLYGRGVIMNITNPKVSIFFLAFLPQFVDPLKGPLTLQFLMLGALFIVATILIFGAISLLAGALGDKFRESARAQKILNRGAGAVFVGLALKLATSQR